MITPSPTANAQDVTANPWIDWAGGECPVSPGAVVDVILGVDSRELHHGLADHYEWSHNAPVTRYDAQITAYRVVQS